MDGNVLSLMKSLLAHYIACSDLYLQFADSHSQSLANSVVNFECKMLSTGAASGSEGAQNP